MDSSNPNPQHIVDGYSGDDTESSEMAIDSSDQETEEYLTSLEED